MSAASEDLDDSSVLEDWSEDLSDDGAGPSSQPPLRAAQSMVDLRSIQKPTNKKERKIAKQARDGIKVLCRFRPPNDEELSKGGGLAVRLAPDGRQVTLEMGDKVHGFKYTHAFGPESSQEEIYDIATGSMVADLLDGYNTAIIAYGQTGAGKTYTMMGPGADDARAASMPEYTKGIIPRILEELYEAVDNTAGVYDFDLRASYIEIYRENLFDLLDPDNTNAWTQQRTGGLTDNLKIRENDARGIYITNAIEAPVPTLFDSLRFLRMGNRVRHIAETKMNVESSRSHAIYLVSVRKTDRISGDSTFAQLYLVDLAGSEKVSKTQAEGERLAEAGNINASLLALGQVIASLTTPSKKKKKGGKKGSKNKKGGKSRPGTAISNRGANGHIPYRDSKLTHLLKNALGGNARTTVIINCSPHRYNAEETLSTLRFGDRSSHIKNNPFANRYQTVDQLTSMLVAAEKTNVQQAQYIAVLEEELRRMNALAGLEGLAIEAALPLPPMSSMSTATMLPPSLVQAHAAQQRKNKGKAPSSSSTSPLALSQSSTTAVTARPPKTKHSMALAEGGSNSQRRADVFCFLCPLSNRIMRDPVVASDGYTYDRESLRQWRAAHGNVSPITKNTLANACFPNYNLRRLINKYHPNGDDDSTMDLTDTLPDEILELVFSFLPPHALASVEVVCKRWRIVAQFHPVWKDYLSRDYNVESTASGFVNSERKALKGLSPKRSYLTLTREKFKLKKASLTRGIVLTR